MGLAVWGLLLFLLAGSWLHERQLRDNPSVWLTGSLALAFPIWLFWAVWKARREHRRRRRCCMHCGYDFRLVEGTLCPECGRSTPRM